MNGILLLAMALTALGIMALGHKKGFQPNLVILIVASAASFIPAVPRVEVEPHLILGAIMPPLLYAAALNFSFASFLRNFRPIFGLGVGLVVATTFVIGYFTSWIIPALGLGSAFVLAAVVSPPDTVTIVSHGKELGLPKRVRAILTGESLVNDAAALTIFSIAVASVMGEQTFIESPVLLFLYGAFVGTIIGAVLGNIAAWARTTMGSATLNTALGLILPFAAYFIAELAHASGVLAVVMAAFTLSLSSQFTVSGTPRQLDYRTRTMEREVWPVVETLLEAFVYAYMGLQLRWVIEDLDDSGYSLPLAVGIGALVLLAVIVIRIVWVFALYWPSALGWRARTKRLAQAPELAKMFDARLAEYNESRAMRGRPPRVVPQPSTWQASLLTSWMGMRGIVTLGAAGSIPLTLASGEDFPGRTIIQFVAFVVAFGTLIIQGLTVPLLIKRLRFDVSDELALEASDLAKAQAVADAVDGSFDAKRDAISYAVQRNEIDDEAARAIVEKLDRQQSASS
jgi:CPA1 family monovalent cation:H+ antiporter